MSTDLHTLSGAYAIDALSPEEVEAFRTHLAQCQVCCDEVRELRHAAAQMGAAESLIAPAPLKARVLAAADQAPQLPPLVTPLDHTRTAARKRRFDPRLLLAAAVAVVIAAVGIGVTQIGHDNEPVMAASVSKVFQAPDAHKATVETSNGGRLTVATSASLGSMAVETDRLPQLGDRQVYQLWTMTNGVAISAGVLKDVRDGASMPMPGKRSQVAITIEPAGGSPQPTTNPIVTVKPASV
ncbi:MAG: anti-sigma factor [Nocardioides sp.]